MSSPRSSPRPPVLPPPPAGDWWTETQWQVLWSLMDAILIPIVPESSDDNNNNSNSKSIPEQEFRDTVARVRSALAHPPDEALVVAFLADRPSEQPAFRDAVKTTLARMMPELRSEMGGLLSLLSGRIGAWALTGYVTPFHQQPAAVRESILRGWTSAWTPTLRKTAHALCMLAQLNWVVTSELFNRASGFSDVPANWGAHQTRAKTDAPFDYTFVQFDDGDTPEILETDIVIVGSGCGGSVVAEVLASAGHRVTVVDKGYHYTPDQLPMPQNTGLRLLYENGGVVPTVDPAIGMLAGSCWGGGGTINWSVCLRTPLHLRQAWAKASSTATATATTATSSEDMSFLLSPAYEASMDRVLDFMCGPHHDDGGADCPDHSHRARVLLDGAPKLQYAAAPLLQNTPGGRPHNDGYCHLGCSSGHKRGPAVSWLPAAARAGAQFIEGFRVDRVLFDDDDGTADKPPTIAIGTVQSPPRAVGVVGTWLSRDASGSATGPLEERRQRRVVIRAKKVVVSAGTLWSPVLLMKSGLQNPQIGKNLHIHPVLMVTGYFDEETKPMDHGILTSICTSFTNMDGHHHGATIEPTSMLPYTTLPFLPWRGALDSRLAALRFRHTDTFISITRDRDSGRVLCHPTAGQPVIDYSPSAFGRESALEGALGAARLCHAQGANEIRVYLPGSTSWHRPAAAAAADSHASTAPPPSDGFEAWVTATRAIGLSMSSIWGGWQAAAPYASAHQMGTCRMGADNGAASVVDPRGRVWHTDGLYVADASIFPTASGVNPMVTVMALADHVAQGIAKELDREKEQ